MLYASALGGRSIKVVCLGRGLRSEADVLGAIYRKESSSFSGILAEAGAEEGEGRRGEEKEKCEGERYAAYLNTRFRKPCIKKETSFHGLHSTAASQQALRLSLFPMGKSPDSQRCTSRSVVRENSSEPPHPPRRKDTRSSRG